MIIDAFWCSNALLFYYCKICNKKIDRVNHNCDNGRCTLKKCQKCKILTFSTGWYYFHKRKCVLQRPFECETCNYQTQKARYLQQHYTRKHGSQEMRQRFKCDQCNAKYTSKKNLDIHKLSKHSQDQSDKLKLNCNECTFSTYRNDSLKKHIRNKHLSSCQRKWFECAQCNVKYADKATLEFHRQRKHTSIDLEKFYCSVCPFQTLYSRALKQHIDRKHVTDMQKLKCSECAYQTNYKLNLTKHILNRHTPEDEGQWFKCQFCTYKSRGRFYLKRHANVCHSEKNDLKERIC